MFRGTDRFRVEGTLGAGGMGVVYRAFDKERGTYVALKTLHRSEGKALQDFKREFRSLADVVDRNLVGLNELQVEGDRWFFTMELVEGMDLLEYVRGGEQADVDATVPATTHPDATTRDPRPPEDGADDPNATAGEMVESETVEVGTDAPPPVRKVFADQCHEGRLRFAFRQLTSGVMALHRAQKLHRDLKPTNVLVDGTGRVVLLDFGLVADLGAGAENVGEFAGTLTYMAPEQVAQQPLTEASDWYGVGVMLYQALTGALPFSGESQRVIWQKTHVEPRPPSELVQGVPVDLEDLCLDLLKREPGDRPDGMKILERLGESIEDSRSSLLVPPPRHRNFVGRNQELAILRNAFDTVGQGTPVIVHVRGRSGLGKTALLEHFLETAKSEGAVVLDGRCYERESVPYKALDGLVDGLGCFLTGLPREEARDYCSPALPLLARLFPGMNEVISTLGISAPPLKTQDVQELRRQAFGALRTTLSRIGAAKRLILSIDDLQWGDLDSAPLLLDLLRPPDPPRLLLLLAYRGEQPTSKVALVEALRDQEEKLGVRSHHLDIGPLATGDATELAKALLKEGEAPSDVDLQSIVEESKGTPLFVEELVQYISYRETIADPELKAKTRSRSRVSLEEMLETRIAQLPEPARNLLETVAVASRPIPRGIVFEAAGIPKNEESLLVTLRASGLLRTSGGRELDQVETFHDRVRETVVGRLSTERRRSVSLALARALEASPARDVEMLAELFGLAEAPEEAARYALAAAEHAMNALAFDRAARFFRRTLELRPDHPERPGWTIQLGEALENAGRTGEAAKAYLDAATVAPPSRSLELRRRASEQFLLGGHVEEGMRVLDDVLRAVGLKMPSTQRNALMSALVRRGAIRVRGLDVKRRSEAEVPSEDLARIDACWSVARSVGLVDFIRAMEFQVRHLLYALRAGEPYRLARALSAEIGYLASAGGSNAQRVREVAALSRQLVDELGRPELLGFHLLEEGGAEYYLGRWKTAHELLVQSEDLLRNNSAGMAHELATARLFLLWCQHRLGVLYRSRHVLPAWIDEAKDRGDRFAEAAYRTGNLPFLYLVIDDPEAGYRELEGALEPWAFEGFQGLSWLEARAYVELDLYTGRAREAWDRLVSIEDPLKKSLLMQAQIVRGEYLDYRARAALGMAARGEDPSHYLSAAARDAKRLTKERMPWLDALALLAQAGVAFLGDDAEEAKKHLKGASDAFEEVGFHQLAACSRRVLGRLSGGADGAEMVKRADRWFLEHGVRSPDRMERSVLPWAPLVGPASVE